MKVECITHPSSGYDHYTDYDCNTSATVHTHTHTTDVDLWLGSILPSGRRCWFITFSCWATD